ncbi:hypothetical protein BHU72_10525 [Desulfuribacillus stibiiarsenatis]|uniref:GGDEF domain-containing protein n=1 Tax=Desulfuribacillus stibiiarsenatis TaxID=1390249 RepID=A0A1E5L9Q4_9FIRM|nr:GGDEF domain-containing protein [Desulfuribacillus stibiiarsenatis]OEH86673.1 hypothetical protein BHU72_10525 [Desulfuribacillus stibiiarsenatis]
MSVLMTWFVLIFLTVTFLYLTWKVYKVYLQTFDTFLFYGFFGLLIFSANVLLWGVNYFIGNFSAVSVFISICFMIGYGLIFWAFFHKVSICINSKSEKTIFGLDILIVITVSITIALYVAVKPFLTTYNFFHLTNGLIILYPIIGVILLFTIIMIWSHERSIQNQTFTVTIIGLLVMITSSTLFNYHILNETYRIGSWIDIFYMASLCILAYAFYLYVPATYCDCKTEFDIPDIRKTFAPYIFVAVWFLLFIFSRVSPIDDDWEASLYNSGVILIFLTILKQLIISLENRKLMVQLDVLSSTDALTGSLNRHFLNRYALKLHESGLERISILFIDLVKFKEFNDTYGHIAGDERLKQLVSLMDECIKDDKYIIRYGGDEFIVLLPDAEKRVAEKAKQSLETCLATYSQAHSDMSPLLVTVGINTSTDLDILKIIDKADREMYKNKRFSEL